MNPSKFASVVGMDGAARYSYFVRKVADGQWVWGLERSGWAMAADDSGVSLLPFWPEEAFAQACATGAWAGYIATKIDLDAFVDRWLPGMSEDGIKVAVFPTPGDRGVVVDPGSLRSALVSEKAQYE